MAALNSAAKTSLDKVETAKFAAMAEEWWDYKGKFAPLHKFNPVRISYILEKARNHFNISEDTRQPLKGLNLLDIGCGGGLLSEPMAKLGADVTGIDAAAKNIEIAKTHASQERLRGIKYIHATVEELLSTPKSRTTSHKSYDIVLCMEVVEHVANVPEFIENCCKLVKPGGIIFVATINRTAKSFLSAIIGAEYILRWLPKGTHDWSKFLKPSEIERHFRKSGIKLQEINGMGYKITTSSWRVTNDPSVNYIMWGRADS